MIWLFPKTKSMLALFEAIGFLAMAACIKEGLAWYIVIPAWLLVSALVYFAVSAAALHLHNRFLALLFNAQQPGEFVRLYAPLTEAKSLRRNVRFTMKSYLACAYEAMGKYDKALSVLDSMPEQKKSRQCQAQAIIDAQRCGVYLSMGKTDEAKQKYQDLQSSGSGTVREQTMELLRIRIAIADGKNTKKDEAYVLLAISKAATLLQKNELKLLLGRIYAQIGEPELSAAYLREVSACPKELHITADAKNELARIMEKSIGG
jgi:tetratricopeptide (TPR) repeat protein